MEYDVFISYSHAADGRLAPAVQLGLQKIAKPWYRLRNLSVFRDETSLSATPSLWGSIETALSTARYFLLFASPDSAKSKWVGKEVEYWLNHKPIENLLIVLTNGQIVWDTEHSDFDKVRTTAVPEVLFGRLRAEPLWVDLSWASDADDVSLRNPRFRTEIARLAAPIHGQALEALVGEDLRQHRKTIRIARVAVTTLVILLAASLVAGYIAFEQKQVAERQYRTALARELAIRANAVAKDDADLALVLSKRSAEMTLDSDSDVTPESESILYDLLAQESVLGELYPGGSNERAWSWIWAAAFNQDGSRFAVAAQDGLGIWDSNLRLRGFFPQEAVSLAFTPDGQLLASSGRDGAVRIIDANGKEVQTFKSHGATSTSITMFPEGNRLLVTGCDSEREYLNCEKGPAKVWDLEGNLVAALDLGGEFITAACISPNGDHLVTVNENGKGALWKPNGMLVRRIDTDANWLSDRCFSKDGRRFVIGGCPVFQEPDVGMWGLYSARCAEGASVWDVRGEKIAEIARSNVSIADARFLEGYRNDAILIQYTDQTVELRDSNGGSPRRLGEKAEVFSLKSDEQRIVTVDQQGLGRLWDFDLQPVGQFSAHASAYLFALADPTFPRVMTISCDRNRQGACWRGSIRVRGLQGSLDVNLPGHEDGVRVARFNRDATMILTLDGKGVARIWSRDGELIEKIAYPSAAIRDGYFTGIGDDLITLSCADTSRNSGSNCLEGKISRWSMKGRKAKEFRLDVEDVHTFAAAPADNRLAVIVCLRQAPNGDFCDEEVPFLVDLLSGKKYQLGRPTKEPLWVAVDTRRRHIVVVSGEISKWDYQGNKIGEIRSYGGESVVGVSFDLASNRVLVGTEKNYELWDLANGDLIREVSRGSAMYGAMAADKGFMLAAVNEGVELWRQDPRLKKILNFPPSPGAGALPPKISPDGSRIVALGCHEASGSAGLCRREGLWMWGADGQLVNVLYEPSKDVGLNVSSFAFDMSGGRLVTGESTGLVRLWGADGNLLTTLGEHRGSVGVTEFCPDGRCLLTAGSQGQAKVWRVFSGTREMLAEVRRRTVRRLDESECRRYLHQAGCSEGQGVDSANVDAASQNMVYSYFRSLEEKDVQSAVAKWSADAGKKKQIAESIRNAQWYRMRRIKPLVETEVDSKYLVELSSKEVGKASRLWKIQVDAKREDDGWRITGIRSIR